MATFADDTDQDMGSEPEYDSDEYEYYVGSDDDSDGDGGAAAGITQPKLARGDSYRVYDEEAMQKRMAEVVDELHQVLALPHDSCSIVLRHFKWNKLTAENRWFENEKKVRSQVGLCSDAELPMTPADGTALVACPTCMDDVPASSVISLNCGHAFCKDCWSGYLRAQLSLGGECIFTRCMAKGCTEAVPDSVWALVLASKFAKRYSMFVFRSFVDTNSYARWCPRPGCLNSVEYPPGGVRDITCKCGHEFCFNCSTEPHRPASCDTVKQWNFKNSAESENVTWILANTKKCPKCARPIEKNQGCNHMTCKRGASGCGFEFCWLCLGPWSEHGTATGGFYKCNKWESQKAAGVEKDSDRKRRKAKNQLDKYIHYFDRYINHDRARKIALRQLPEIQENLETLQGVRGYKLSEVSFIREAAEQVIRCRQVLKWTYVYAYYLENDIERNFFEFLQEHLEKNTEHLHGLVETPLLQYLRDDQDPKVDFFAHRSNVANYTGITRTFLDKLLVGVENGLTETAMMHNGTTTTAAAAAAGGKGKGKGKAAPSPKTSGAGGGAGAAAASSSSSSSRATRASRRSRRK